MSEKVNITVKVNDIEMVIPSEEDVLSVGRDRFISAITPFLYDAKMTNPILESMKIELKLSSDIEAFYLYYDAYKKTDVEHFKPLDLIFKNFDFDEVSLMDVKNTTHIGIYDNKNSILIIDNEYQKIAECMKCIYKMYAKENEEVMKNIDTKDTKENISKDLNNLEEKKTESIGDLKVGLFGSLDINKTRKKIKNSLAKLSSKKEN